MIYGALIIPIFVSAYLLMFHRKDTQFWEPLTIIGVALICIIASNVISVSSQIHATEYWGHTASGIINKEPYSYMSTCTRSYSCGTSKNPRTCTETYPCVENVSRNCSIVYPTRSDDGSGDEIEFESYRISYAKYKQLDQRWKNNGHKFKQKHRDYYNRKHHGGQHRVYWDKNWKTAEPLVFEYSYENRIQASDSVFNFPEVTEEDVALYGLYQYPDVSAGYEAVTIMDQNKNWAADLYWRYLNGQLGPKKKLRVWILIFKNQPKTAAQTQEALWKGSNKNEFVFCIGTDSNYNITWGHIFTWSESHELKIKARNFVSTNMKVVSDDTLLALGKWSETNLMTFVKKDWNDFDYLEVKPSMTAIVITYVITLLISLGVGLWVVKNKFHDRGKF